MNLPIRGEDANLNQRLSDLFGRLAIFQEQLSGSPEAFTNAVVQTFNFLVDWLKHSSNIDNKAVNELANTMWDTIGNKLVATALYEGVPHITFAVIQDQRNGRATPIILIPPHFVEQASTNPLKELASLVLYSRQIVSFLRGEFDGSPEKSKQSEIEAYKVEASFLESFFKQYTELQPSSYYQKVMASGRGEITYDEFKAQ